MSGLYIGRHYESVTAALNADDGPRVTGKIFVLACRFGSMGTDREGRTLARVAAYQGSWGQRPAPKRRRTG